MTGLLGISISMYSFGLAKTFTGIVIARSLNGALNGNIGVLKSVFGSLFDESNMSQGYAYLPIAWSTGSTLGPLIGGALSWPTRRFPDTFGGWPFFEKYPYFLPCAVPATFALFAWVLSFFYLEETVEKPVPLAVFLRLRKAQENPVLQAVVEGQEPTSTENPTLASTASESESDTRVGSVERSVKELEEKEKPYPLRALLTKDVILAGGNYAALSLVDIAYRGVQPLFFSTPRSLGGLGLSPPEIGPVRTPSYLSIYHHPLTRNIDFGCVWHNQRPLPDLSLRSNQRHPGLETDVHRRHDVLYIAFC
jgi:MFS family permease